MNAYSYYIRTRYGKGWGRGIGPRPTHCHQCGRALPAPTDSCGTGYGSKDEERALYPHANAPTLRKDEVIVRAKAICYPCCGENEARNMRETGRAMLYLTHEDGEPRVYYASNWPGSLKIRISGAVRHSHNNFGAQRVDVWFTFDGARWHGVNLGDNQILRCRRLKGK